jgi:dihydrofolate reductase
MALKQQPGKNIGVHGSPTLVESLLHADLLDELRLEIYPVVAGSGARLFHDGQAVKHLQLADSKVTSNGVVILTYSSPGKAQA